MKDETLKYGQFTETVTTVGGTLRVPELGKEFIKEIESIQDVEFAKEVIKRLLCDARKYRGVDSFAIYFNTIMGKK